MSPFELAAKAPINPGARSHGEARMVPAPRARSSLGVSFSLAALARVYTP